MSSRVTPSSRSTTTRTTLRRPAGVTTSSSRSYPAAADDRLDPAGQPDGGRVGAGGCRERRTRFPPPGSGGRTVRCACPRPSSGAVRPPALVGPESRGRGQATARAERPPRPRTGTGAAVGTRGAHGAARDGRRDAADAHWAALAAQRRRLRGWAAMSPPPRPAPAASPGAPCSRPPRRGWRCWSPGCTSSPADERETGDQRAGRRARPPRSRCRRRWWPRSPRPAPPTPRSATAGGRAGRAGRRAAGPGCGRPPRALVASAASAAAPPAGPDARAWLRGQVAAAADLARRGVRGPVRRPGGAAGIDRRGAARPGRETGMTGPPMADDTLEPGRAGREHRERGAGRGPGRRARGGLGVRRRGRARSADDAGQAAAGAGGGAPRRPRPGRRPARRAGRRAVGAEGGYALPFPVLSEIDAAALAVVLEDGVAAAWVRVLDQAAERATRELAVGALERRRGPRRGLADRGRPDAGHPARSRASPPLSRPGSSLSRGRPGRRR